MGTIDKDVQGFLEVAQGPVMNQIALIQEGIRRSVFTKMAQHIGMPQKALAQNLGLEERTLRNRSARRRLTEIESEKSLRVARVFAKACKVLGDDESAKSWIVSTIESLGNRRPIDFLETDVGTQEVMNVLSAIEWNVYL